MYLIFAFWEFKSIHKGKMAILHLCFGTEENRRLGSKKARYIRAFRRRHLFCLHIMVGEGGFEPPKSLTTDLQSAPFGHSGIPPYMKLWYTSWSWWRESNPQPADYKSAALPLSHTSELVALNVGLSKCLMRCALSLRRSLSPCDVCYYITFRRLCQ